MDWKQFLANVIGSLAWPVAAVFIAAMFRRQVILLLRRLAELSLPGGYKFVFKEALEENRKPIDTIGSKGSEVKRLRSRDHSLLTFDEDTFEGLDMVSQMLAAYAVVEQLIAQLATASGLTGTHWATWRALQEKGVISEAAANAIENLRKARNAFVHIPGQVNVNEAVEFVGQAMVLRDYLQEALKKAPQQR